MKRRPPEPTRRQRWLPYVRSIADRIHLKDWIIEIGDDKPAYDWAIATVKPIEGRRLATLRFNDCFFDDPPDRQRATIAHELIHCHLATYAKAVEKKTRDDPILHMLMEHSVDAIAEAIAPLLPLPPKELRP